MDEDYYVVGTEGPDIIYAYESGDGAGGDDYVSGSYAAGGTGSDEVDGVEGASGDAGNDLVRHALYTMAGGSGRDVFFRFERFYDTEQPDRRLIQEGRISDFNPEQDKIASPVRLFLATEFTGLAGQMVFSPDDDLTRIDLDGDGEWEISMSGKADPSHYIPIVLDGTNAGEVARGNGLLVGGGGEDTLSGGVGEDILFGGFGNDVLSGGRNDDLLVGNADADRLNGGAGDDELDGGDGDDILSGGDGDDVAAGGAGADVVAGGGGADALSGDGGADRLNGGNGDDTLMGGAGADFLIGGAGADTFVFRAGDSGAASGTRDRISDFEGGIDIIDLSAFHAAAVTLTAGTGYDRLSIDADGNGTIDSVILVEVLGAAHLTMSDLLL